MEESAARRIFPGSIRRTPYGQNIDPRLRFRELKRVECCPALRSFTGRPRNQCSVTPGVCQPHRCPCTGAIGLQPQDHSRLFARLRGFLMIITQQPAQPFATLHRPASSHLRVTRKQQDVVLPLMITLRMVMRNIFAQRQPQGALTDEKQLGQTLLLYRPHPALRIGIQVRATHRQRKRFHST
jgi:hypothetical protein